MTTPRYQLVDENQPLCYHLVSRCVRGSWLCGFDRTTRKDYTHRKVWLTERLHQLGSAFSLDIYAYAIMSNHFHLVVYYDPKASQRWSDREVADRWLSVCPPRDASGAVDEGLKELYLTALLEDPAQVEQLRVNLGSLSLFMKLLKQPIARRANLEDGVKGHFFEQRFYSGALLSEDAVLAAMAYTDLNPARAKLARSLSELAHTSVHERLSRDPADLDRYLAPVVAGLEAEMVVQVTLRDYTERLEVLIPSSRPGWKPGKWGRWHDQVVSLKKRQRAYGTKSQLESWMARWGWQLREEALPI